MSNGRGNLGGMELEAGSNGRFQLSSNSVGVERDGEPSCGTLLGVARG